MKKIKIAFYILFGVFLIMSVWQSNIIFDYIDQQWTFLGWLKENKPFTLLYWFQLAWVIVLKLHYGVLWLSLMFSIKSSTFIYNKHIVEAKNYV
jgi:hypothetical protein